MKYLLLVPVYNAEHLLPFFFQSIRDMNPKPDYIVWSVNNCTDNTVPMLKDFRDIPSEIIKLPDFPPDFITQHGSDSAIGIVYQSLWERARELNSEWTFLCDVDEWAVSTDILSILSHWNVDFVATRKLLRDNYRTFISALWSTLKPTRWEIRMAPYWTREIEIQGCKLIIARIAHPTTPALDSTVLVANGFFCFSRRLIQDRRLNWHPFKTPPDLDEKQKKMLDASTVFCCSARDLGYKIHLDGIAVITHVLYDSKRQLKPWTFDKDEKPIGMEYFKFGESKSQ
jgi:hypothetical protein